MKPDIYSDLFGFFLVCLVLSLFLGGCNSHLPEAFKAYTTPGPAYGPCGAGIECADHCCDSSEWRCVPDGCEWMGVPEDQPTVHYWSASRDGGASVDLSKGYPKHH